MSLGRGHSLANLDVTELLFDPDFVDDLTLIRREATVNAFGENIITEITFNTIGSVQPASGKTISRLPDALRVANISSFWIKADIIVDGTGKYPSIISFRGKRYQVQTVSDWQNYGAGWNEGTAVAEKPVG